MSVGYVFFSPEHGGFSPEGKVAGMSEDDVKRHNARMAAEELERMKAEGRGVLYYEDGKNRLTNWDGSLVIPVSYSKHSRHNMSRSGRWDLWFEFDGGRWHGVNIGDMQLTRVKRLKG